MGLSLALCLVFSLFFFLFRASLDVGTSIPPFLPLPVTPAGQGGWLLAETTNLCVMFTFQESKSWERRKSGICTPSLPQIVSCVSERSRKALLFCSKIILPQLQQFGVGNAYVRVQRGLGKAQHVQEWELSPDIGLMEKWVQFLVCCTISCRTAHSQAHSPSHYSSGRQLLGSSSFSFPCSWEVAFQTAASPWGKGAGNELLKILFWDLISFKVFSPFTFISRGLAVV